MFSVENLYYILYVNLFKRINVDIEYFSKFGSIDINDLQKNFSLKDANNSRVRCYFYDQEPIQTKVLDQLLGMLISPKTLILLTSEHSAEVKNYCKKEKLYSIYYFFHGFACLYWYNDTKYFEKNPPKWSNTFISMNRLCTSDRSYRLLLVTELLNRNIDTKGKISLQFIKNNENIIKKELIDPHNKLSKHAKIKVYKTLGSLRKNFIIDQEVTGTASAHCGRNEYELWQSCFLHVVSETVFFHEKLHLTEKIFKPIVSLRPFVLLGAYKNLEYLKTYGFKTFDKWIDESYDDEPDNEKRLLLVCNEIEKIANLSETEIQKMYFEMQSILEFNYKHFFSNFKNIIVDELVNNFEGFMRQYNNGNLSDEVYDIESLNLPEVKRLLTQ